jgi:16S rRNA (guanine527-N7)-methyltransferase
VAIKAEQFKAELSSYLKQLQLKVDSCKLEQLWEYYIFFKEENQKYNLSSITEADQVIKKHFLDSLVILNYLVVDSGQKWLDIGTGAGFPGLVLKLFLPESQFVLLDSVAKKINFLNKLIYKLKLQDVKAIHARAEDLAKKEEWRAQFDHITSRAVASLNVLSEYAVPFLKIGGTAYFYKGPEYETELEEAKSALKTLGAVFKNAKKLAVPGLEAERYLITVEKVKLTPAKYPRRAGMPKKRPL